MKIEDLQTINILKEKTNLLLNHHIDDEFYNFYFKKDLKWLTENQEKIKKDFSDNIDKLKFDIILNTSLDERINLILELKNATIEEFTNYISIAPYNILSKRTQKEMNLLFEKFKSEDDYMAIQYFDRIKR